MVAPCRLCFQGQCPAPSWIKASTKPLFAFGNEAWLNRSFALSSNFDRGVPLTKSMTDDTGDETSIVSDTSCFSATLYFRA